MDNLVEIQNNNLEMLIEAFFLSVFDTIERISWSEDPAYEEDIAALFQEGQGNYFDKRPRIYQLIGFFDILQTALISDYIPSQLNETVNKNIIQTFSIPGVRQYCIEHELVLPQLLEKHVESPVSYSKNGTIEEGFDFFENFLLLNEGLEDSDLIEMLTLFTDSSKKDLLQSFCNNIESYLDSAAGIHTNRVLSEETEKYLVGFSKLVQFISSLYDLVQPPVLFNDYIHGNLRHDKLQYNRSSIFHYYQPLLKAVIGPLNKTLNIIATHIEKNKNSILSINSVGYAGTSWVLKNIMLSFNKGILEFLNTTRKINFLIEDKHVLPIKELLQERIKEYEFTTISD